MSILFIWLTSYRFQYSRFIRNSPLFYLTADKIISTVVELQLT